MVILNTKIVALALIAAFLLGAVSTAAHMQDAIDEVERKAARECHHGAKYSVIKPDGEFVCVYDDRKTYGMADRRVYVPAD